MLRVCVCVWGCVGGCVGVGVCVLLLLLCMYSVTGGVLSVCEADYCVQSIFP